LIVSGSFGRKLNPEKTDFPSVFFSSFSAAKAHDPAQKRRSE
jgi:hypothetical protein